ncbi:DMT family transporter [Chromobacterium vaccinii]|uniref:DMT family transporter n=1 Tax=Chromobacterium vaccinii TaxID=1108595 RepID=UPI000618337C|nr:EamA family transporter [Chromobacterium vaccinii]QND85889.1 O-acetylserine/cysteine exporter [Chromobacterium vaccinii]QND91120.1 O-acetylserine/cysteine exporter [Chromobacterium vaccinii]
MKLSKAILIVLLSTGIFGFNYVAAKVSSVRIDPVETAMLRVAFAALPACLFLRLKKDEFLYVLLYGVAFALGLFLFFKGLKTGIDAGISSVIMQAGSLFTAAGGILILKERWNKFNVIGCLIAMFGIYSISKIKEGGINVAGIAFVLGSAFSWTFANLSVRMSRTERPLAFVSWGSLVSAVLLFVINLSGERSILSTIGQIDQQAWLAIAFQGYVTTLIGYGLWTLLLSQNQLVLSAPSYLLVPGFALFFSHIVLGEAITAERVLFSLVVVAGIIINASAQNLSTLGEKKKPVMIT